MLEYVKLDRLKLIQSYCIYFIIDRQISSKFIKTANVSKKLCSDKFNRIFLHRQIGYMLVSKMAKFGPANFKDDRVISIVLRKCDENVT